MRAGDEIEVLRPKNLQAALSMMAEAHAAGTPLTPLAGGTDLLVVLNAGKLAERRFIDLWPLAHLRGIKKEKGSIAIGALATFTDCIRSKEIQSELPILAEAAREVGGLQIQNRGTVAGNVGNASPAGDSLPVLAVCDTTIVLSSATGERSVPFDAYYTGYRASVRRPDELITRILITVPPGKQLFRKVGTRAAQAISKIAIAAIGHRIAFGSVAPTVVRARTVEKYLQGGGPGGKIDLAEARRLLADDIHPIDDIRSTAEYRLRVAQNLLALVV